MPPFSYVAWAVAICILVAISSTLPVSTGIYVPTPIFVIAGSILLALGLVRIGLALRAPIWTMAIIIACVAVTVANFFTAYIALKQVMPLVYAVMVLSAFANLALVRMVEACRGRDWLSYFGYALSTVIVAICALALTASIGHSMDPDWGRDNAWFPALRYLGYAALVGTFAIRLCSIVAVTTRAQIEPWPAIVAGVFVAHQFVDMFVRAHLSADLSFGNVHTLVLWTNASHGINLILGIIGAMGLWRIGSVLAAKSREVSPPKHSLDGHDVPEASPASTPT